MIRKRGHYIVETTLPPNHFAHCLKCRASFTTPHGRASTAWVFDETCVGDWKESERNLKIKCQEAKESLKALRRLRADDRKGLKTARSTPSGSPAPLLRRNASDRRP